MKRNLVLLLFIIANITYPQIHNKIAFGPYIQNMGPKDAKICWSTLSGTTKITNPDGSIAYIPEYKQHRILLTRLKPNSEYEYDVLRDGTDEGRGKFKTYPDEIAPFKFVVLGDTRSNPEIHSNIVSRVMGENPLFVINTGDLVSNGRDIKNWESFFKVNKEIMKSIPYYAVLGNHEKDSPYFYDFFPPPGENNYYSFYVGDALFVILDSEGRNISAPNYISDHYEDQFWNDSFEEYFQKQKDWLDKELEIHKEAGFVFIFQHKPLFSIKSSRVDDTNKLREFWGDIFERHQVQAFINGHDHHYHHAFKNGVHYITTAGGGAGLYETDSPQPETVNYSKINHFLSINVFEEESIINVIDIDGNKIDEIILKKKDNK